MAKRDLPHDHGDALPDTLEHMPDAGAFAAGAATFQQLSDPSRLRIFWLLCHSEECGANLAAALEMSQASISHHLKSLRLHGLVHNRREGKEIYYTLADNSTARLAHQMVDDFFCLTCPTEARKAHENKGPAMAHGRGGAGE